MLARSLIALAIGALVIGVIMQVTRASAQTANRVVSYTEVKKNIDELSRVSKKTAHDCASPFIPAKTIFGAANPNSPAVTDPKYGFLPGSSPAAVEVDIYCENGQQAETFYAFVYDAPSGAISEYQYGSRDATGTAQAVDNTPIAIWKGPFNYFSASYLNASSVATGNPYVAQTVTQGGDIVIDKLVNLGYPEVFAGNRAVVIAFGTAGGLFGKAVLAPRTFPESTIVKPVYAPGHQPMTVAPSALYFQYGGPGTQTFTAQDPNFKASFVPTNGCGSSAGIGGGGNGPTANFTASVSVTTLGGVAPFNCPVSIDTYDHSVPTQTVTLYITPTGPLVDQTPSISFASPAAPAAPASIYEAYYYSGPITVDATTPRPDGLQACGNAVTIDGASGETKQVDDGTFTAAFSIDPNTTGSTACALHFVDDHGGAVWSAVAITGYGALSVSPGNVALNTGAQQNVTISEGNYGGPFSYSSNCGGAVAFSPPSGSITGPTSVLQATGNSPITCNLVVNDNHNNDRGSPTGAVTVPITVISLKPGMLVCDPQSPARPRGTDIGPDPDGIHEDISNGTTCGALVQVVCYTDPRAGTTDNATNPPTQYVGTGRAPPCSQTTHCSPSGEPAGTPITVGGVAYFADGNPCQYGAMGLQSASCAVLDYENPGWELDPWTVTVASADPTIFSNSLQPVSAGTTNVTVSGTWDTFNADLKSCFARRAPLTVSYSVTVWPDGAWEATKS